MKQAMRKAVRANKSMAAAETSLATLISSVQSLWIASIASSIAVFKVSIAKPMPMRVKMIRNSS